MVLKIFAETTKMLGIEGSDKDLFKSRDRNKSTARRVTCWIASRVCKIPKHIIQIKLKQCSSDYTNTCCKKIDYEIIYNNDAIIDLICQVCTNLKLITQNDEKSMQKVLLEIMQDETVKNEKPVSAAPVKVEKERKEPHPQKKDFTLFLEKDAQWAKRETQRNGNLTTEEEKQMYYNALVSACEWGRRCDFDNYLHREKAKRDTVNISMIR